MPKCLLIFGSVARGTATDESDIDLLAVGGDLTASSMKTNGVEVQNYSVEKFLSLAVNGDLFGAHLAHEAKAIFDPLNLFNEFKEGFQLKQSYSSEIKDAFDLAGFLHQFGKSFADQDLVSKRLAWCVRTVLIAKLAERRRMVFSPEGLYREFHFDWADHLISQRRHGAGKTDWSLIEKFLRHFEYFGVPRTQGMWFSCFEANNNQVAISTFKKLTEPKVDPRSKIIHHAMMSYTR